MKAKTLMMVAAGLPAMLTPWEKRESEQQERLSKRIHATCPACNKYFNEIGNVFCSEKCSENYSKERNETP